MDVKQEINPKAFIYTLPHSFFIATLSKASEKNVYKSHPGAKGSYRHNGLRIMSQKLLASIYMVYFLS